MIAEPAPRFSERPTELQPHARGFGDRFFYFRGRSGRRYIFTHVDERDAADFDDALVATAEPVSGDRLALRSVGLDHYRGPPRGAVVLVHLLAAGREERLAALEDLAGVRVGDALRAIAASRAPSAVALAA